MKKILKFYNPTCGPCKAVSRNLDALEGVEIQGIDIADEANKPLYEKWGVKSIPTILVIDENENLIREFHGVISAEQVKEVL